MTFPVEANPMPERLAEVGKYKWIPPESFPNAHSAADEQSAAFARSIVRH